jgi:5-methylcytosine-specific restriction endonuclease McrA
MERSVLVLNNTYEAIHICSLRRAIGLVLKGVAVMEDRREGAVRSLHSEYPVPAVIRLTRYVYVPRKDVHLTRKNVVLRDKHMCQYCGKEHRSEELTMDHVTPRSLGGATTWENVVACCRRCNNLKADRSPREAGLRLIKKPEMPRRILYLHVVRHLGQEMEQWKKYIFY